MDLDVTDAADIAACTLPEEVHREPLDPQPVLGVRVYSQRPVRAVTRRWGSGLDGRAVRLNLVIRPCHTRGRSHDATAVDRPRDY
jgi:hypothetical protein